MKFRWCTLRFIPRLNHCVSYLWFFMVPKSIRQAKLDQIRPFRASSAFQVESVDWAFNSPSIGALYHKGTLCWHSHCRLTTLTSSVVDFEAKSCIRMRLWNHTKSKIWKWGIERHSVVNTLCIHAEDQSPTHKSIETSCGCLRGRNRVSESAINSAETDTGISPRMTSGSVTNSYLVHIDDTWCSQHLLSTSGTFCKVSWFFGFFRIFEV